MAQVEQRIFFRDLPITDEHWRKISMALTFSATSSKGWRRLATLLCNKNVDELDYIERVSRDPVKEVLNDWKVTQNGYVDVLLRVVQEIDNNTVKLIIESLVEDYNVILKKREEEEKGRLAKEAAEQSARANSETSGASKQYDEKKFTLEVRDLNSHHIYNLANILDPAMFGSRPALELAKRLGVPDQQRLQLSRVESPTKSLLNYLSSYGTSQQRKLSYIIHKLREEPPMNLAAEIMEEANKL